MKRYIFLLLVLNILSCGGGGDDSVVPPTDDSMDMLPDDPSNPSVTNGEPTVPSLIFPTNNLLCIDNILEFEWNASTDSEGDPITYVVDISKSISFSELDQSFELNSTNKTITLEKGFAYYWRVKASDSNSASSEFSEFFSIFNFVFITRLNKSFV